MNKAYTVSGQYVDIENRIIFPAEITIYEGYIQQVRKVDQAADQYLLPGFIDAHIHIESSMLVPTEFAAIAVTHGTVATVSDPHEIANVCGMAGIEYMISNAEQSPLKFNFGAPSCVPATPFETAGAEINSRDIKDLLGRKEIKYLAEMMNFPGVLNHDEEVIAKIAAAALHNKPVDGHAPGLRGAAAAAYSAAGISTDHECVSLEEALDKIRAGMYILIREGSAAKNYEALAPLLNLHPGKIMFCSDDKHPDELLKGHIDKMVVRAVAEGYDLYDVLHAACILPIQHYGLDVGQLRKGDPADLIVVGDLQYFEIRQVYIDGKVVAENGRSLVKTVPVIGINNFSIAEKQPETFRLKTSYDTTNVTCKTIEAMDGQLTTGLMEVKLKVEQGNILPDASLDILKIGVVNRYHESPVAMGFIRNFGLKEGAMASSVAHDSHNIVFVGVDDENISRAVNTIIRHRGGISVCSGTLEEIMPLPVAGLMTDRDALTASIQYKRMDAAAKSLGSTLSAPFMTLSFMALPVIPALKMTDKGLFDVDTFTFTNLISNADGAG